MWTSSTKRLIGPAVLFGTALLFSGCASKGGLEADADSNATSKYQQQKTGGAAADSDAVHIPPVPHDPAVEGIAREAMAEYARALQTRRAGNTQQALVMFQSLGSRYPKLSGPALNSGLIHLEQKQFDKAQQALQQCLAINESNPYAHNAMGMVLREQGQFAEARQHYERALMLDPKYARAHFNLAVLGELYLQDLSLALSHFRAYQNLQKQPDENVANWIVDLERRAPEASARPVAGNSAASLDGEMN